MPGTAFDGSIWVQGGQIAALVGGTAATAVIGGLVLARNTASLAARAPRVPARPRSQPLLEKQQREAAARQRAALPEAMEAEAEEEEGRRQAVQPGGDKG